MQIQWIIGGSCLAIALAISPAHAADPAKRAALPGDRALAEYFERETARLSTACLADIHSLEDWARRRNGYRRQLHEMLGLDPLPKRTPLEPVVTGTLDHAQFTVEKLYFQSRPGLYVTANLYIPKGLTQPAPAVLYVCGHGNIKKDGISYGSKAKYQHHPAWFARHGFVSLIIDTLELGEIQGEHHGTYSKGLWWWNARGYTPAGVEAWNSIRAIDYLQSRKEVDPERIGVTGRSGGGAYTWWVAALDERVKAAVPVAGITDLQNHVVDGCVEGHCDCMYMVNTYRWDYAQVAALVAPRQLLLANTDSDRIFPLDGVERIHNHLGRIYKLYDEPNSLGLQISPGPHLDLQELQVAAFHWFNRFLKHEEPLINDAAVPLFKPEELKVFDKLPTDQLNTTIAETFVPLASPPKVPHNASQWQMQRDDWLKSLNKKVFAGWPSEPGALNLRQIACGKCPLGGGTKNDIELAVYEFTSQPGVVLRLHVLRRAGLDAPEETLFMACDQPLWDGWLSGLKPLFPKELNDEPAGVSAGEPAAGVALLTRKQLVAFAPRGIGRSAWNSDLKKQTQIRRRFMLLGQTLESMQVWDIRRAMQALRSLPGTDRTPLALGAAEGELAGLALYASLFEPPVARIELGELPRSHREGPNFLNVLRFLDMPQAVAMAAERAPLTLHCPGPPSHHPVSAREFSRTGAQPPQDWEYPIAVAKSLDWKPEQLEFRFDEPKPPADKK